MKNMTLAHSISIITLFTFSVLSLQAQGPMGGGGYPGGGQGKGSAYQNLGQDPNVPSKPVRMAIGHIYGKIVDAKTKKGMEFVSVALYKLKNDSLIGGQLTETNGDFSLDNLPFGGFKLKINYVGYTPVEQQVIVTPNSMDQDVGNIALSEDNKTLNAVTVTAEKSTLELKPDRKVFNVEKDLSTRGGTGIDVLKNVPGVSTDADGNITLRNNTPIVYIDGKPTTLTLDQVPADQIEKVEVITNPSAKFEAAATGGIINVVLKKNRQPGYNGILTAAIGTNDQYNGMALINVREKKFGFMASYNINGATNRTYSYTDRTNLSEGVPTSYFHQDDHVTNPRLFQTARVGFDFYINNRNTLSISQNGTFGNFKNTDDQTYTTSDSVRNQLTNGLRNSTQTTSFRNFTTDLNFRHTYPKADEEWTLDFNYNHARGTGGYLYNFSSFTPGGSLIPYSLGTGAAFNPESETNYGGSHSNTITAQWDFSDPLGKNMKLEFGARSNFQRQYTNLTVIDYDSSLSQTNPSLSNNYRIDNLINAAYISFNHTIKGFSYQIGLRFEQTYFNGVLLNRNDSSFSYQYPSSAKTIYDCLFPSLNLSQKIGDKHELQFNITRKINRPNFFQISPFIFASDKYNYRIGNPYLQPEFDNKTELNYDLTIPKFTWLSSLYGSYNQQPITQYSYTDPINPQVLVNTFENGKSSINYGWENTFKISPVKGLDITADGNVWYTTITSDIANQLTKNSGIAYNIKGIIAYKFPFGLSVQVNGTYESPRVIPQGHTIPMYFFDISASKDIGPVTINFTVSDVLNSRINGTYYDTDTYLQTQTRRRDQRFARLGVTYKFGKMDGSIFKSKKKKDQGPQNGGEDMGF